MQFNNESEWFKTTELDLTLPATKDQLEVVDIEGLPDLQLTSWVPNMNETLETCAQLNENGVYTLIEYMNECRQGDRHALCEYTGEPLMRYD